MSTTAPHVYEAISNVMADLSAEGISKSRKNQQQGYSFRGIDEVYNALSSVLAKHKLVITPRALSRVCDERQTKSGGALFYVTVDMEFVLTSAVDGSSITARTFGEAMDSADKATNKAMSAAYKYMAMQQFCIPTEGDNDADSHTPDVAARKGPPEPAKPLSLPERADRLEATLKAVKTTDDLNKAYTLGAALCGELSAHMPDRLKQIDDLYEDRRASLMENAA